MYLYIEFLIKVNPCPPSMSYIYIYTSIYETGILAQTASNIFNILY